MKKEESRYLDKTEEKAARAAIESRQQSGLLELFEKILPSNRFYSRKFSELSLQPDELLDRFHRLPFTTKQELVDDAAANPPYGTNLTYPLQAYTRLHQTSGTTGEPLVVLDTPASWQAWKRCWQLILRCAGVGPGDCVYAAFSFGPFVGFWSGYEAASELGCRVLTGGGQTSLQRLQAIRRHDPTVLLCTPSYALYLAEVARDEGIDTRDLTIRTTIHAGEPGASIPATRKKIEQLWQARCYDHIGASEVGPYGFECHRRPGGVHVNELDYVCEVIDPGSLQPMPKGEPGELVITTLNRAGFPVIRYRTGDIVTVSTRERCACGRAFALLKGGVLGRADDMMTVRGVNIYPSSVEAVLRKFHEVVEFEGRIQLKKQMQQLILKVELAPGTDRGAVMSRLEESLKQSLGIRLDLEPAEPGELPRYELKASRFKKE